MITVTLEAAKHVKNIMDETFSSEELEEFMAKELTPRLRIQVSPGGCSGFSTETFFDTAENPGDNIQKVEDVLEVIVDSESAALLQGATLEWKNNGMIGGGLSLNNPNAQRTCGCGQSFS